MQLTGSRALQRFLPLSLLAFTVSIPAGTTVITQAREQAVNAQNYPGRVETGRYYGAH